VLFSHLMAMNNDGKRIDATLLLARIEKSGEIEAVGGSAYIAEVVDSVPHSANAVYYAEIVRDKAALRALIHAGSEVIREAYESTGDPKELVGRAEEMLFAISNRRRSSEGAIGSMDLMLHAFDRIDAVMAGSIKSGTGTGFADLDKLTGGLHDSELTILAARPSIGKTACALNIAEHVAVKLKIPVLIFSLEMSEVELAQRFLCAVGRVDSHKLRNGFLSQDDRRKLVEASAVISQSPLWTDDAPTRSCMEIASISRRFKRQKEIGLVIIDYLQLIRPDDPRDVRQEQVAKMSRRLKALARELKIPVLCLAQLNRQVDQAANSRKPRLSALRESGAIEQDADIVMFLWREWDSSKESRDINQEGIVNLSIAKQRNGPTGDVKLAWQDRYVSFENLAETPRSYGHEEFAEFA